MNQKAAPSPLRTLWGGALGIQLAAEADYAPVTRTDFTKTVSNPTPPPLNIQVPFFDDNANHSGALEDPMTDSRDNLVHALTS